MKYLIIDQEKIQQLNKAELERSELYKANPWSGICMINGVKNDYNMFRYKVYYFIAAFNFLSAYAEENCYGAEVDIQKLALYINSAYFENAVARTCVSLQRCYKIFEYYVEHNIPIHRFLKLTPYQLTVLEKQHYNQLQSDYENECSHKNCYSCLYYKIDILELGTVEQCNNKKMFTKRLYQGFKIKENCKYYEKNQQRITDNCIIPLTMQYVDIAQKDFQMWDCLEYGFRGVKIRIDEVKTFLFIKGIYEFLKVYINNEVNVDAEINIGNLSKYLYKRKFKYTTEEEFYDHIENLIMQDKIYQFIRYPDREKIRKRTGKFLKALGVK